MNIYLVFENYKDVPIFDIEISQEEDCFARATLLIAAGTPLPPLETEGIIQGKGILFKGLLLGCPIKVEGNFAKIELVSLPVDLRAQLHKIHEESRIPPYWEELCVGNSQTSLDLQDVFLSSLYGDRRGGDLTRSDWFEGRHSLDIQQDFFKDSLRLSVLSPPLKSCTVNVHAHWVQREEGVENISPALRMAFPRGKVSSYTKNAIVEQWPQAGKRVGRSGVWVLKSELQETHPPAGSFPLYSPPLRLSTENDETKFRSYRVKRHWFKPTLWVGWTYHQKRKETLSVTLHHGVQSFVPGEGEDKIVEITLQNINPDPQAYGWFPNTFYYAGTPVIFQSRLYHCATSHMSGLTFEEEEKTQWVFQRVVPTPLGAAHRASFFLTDRGYQVADHALERAKAILAKSARAIEISFEGPWDLLCDVTTDCTLALQDPRLPGGRVRGKVVRYALIVKGETGARFVRVTLACSLGISCPASSPPSPQSPYSEGDYDSQDYQVRTQEIRSTPSGMAYWRYDAHQPPVRERGPLLRRLELINGPEEQEIEMARYASHTPRALKHALSRLPTRLRLWFRDLRTKDQLDHLIPVQILKPWSAPQQVLLAPSGSAKTYVPSRVKLTPPRELDQDLGQGQEQEQEQELESDQELEPSQ